MNIPHKANDTKIFTETLETANFAIVGHFGGVVRTSERTFQGFGFLNTRNKGFYDEQST